MKTFEDFYLKKDYSSALKVLERNAQKIDPGLWHYNIGTVMGEIGQWPEARYHFVLAKEYGFDAIELEKNQALAEEKLEIHRLERPIESSDYLIKGALFASQGLLLTVSLMILITGLFFIKKYSSFKSRVLLIVSFALPLLVNGFITLWPRQIVMTAKPIYEGPSVLFNVSGELPPGVMVLTQKKGEWEEVIYPSRFSGWIKSDGLKMVEKK